VKVAVICEQSAAVRDAFIARGHDAVSCDIEASWNGGLHIQGDARAQNWRGYDLLICHPPCTYLSRAGARWMYKQGRIDRLREKLQDEAIRFFEWLWNLDVTKIVIENPIMMRRAAVRLPPRDQIIQPYEYGHPYSKATCLWLKGVEPLRPTKIIPALDRLKDLIENTGGGKRRPILRSVTPKGIADAMADQWGASS